MKHHRSAVVIGGGFYGSAIALHLAKQGWQVTLVEKQSELMTRASYVNQARLHNGCHYPRSFATAIRSRANLPYFRDIYAPAVYDQFRAIYAIARNNSRVSAQHYQRFCQAAQISIKPARREDRALFDAKLVEAVYEVDEPAFDATALRDQLLREIIHHAVSVRYNTAVTAIGTAVSHGSELAVRLSSREAIPADWVFNCTYAALNHTDGRTSVQRPALRYQIAEIALIRPPAELIGRGITLVDGAFFSTMPFPPKGLHSMTHVRYTHHSTWIESGHGAAGPPRHPYDIMAEYLDTGGGARNRSRVNWMLRDAQRFVPILATAGVENSLFEIKTFVAETEIDDARPIFFHRDETMPRLVSILGAKIDNVFDILTYVDRAVGHD